MKRAGARARRASGTVECVLMSKSGIFLRISSRTNGRPREAIPIFYIIIGVIKGYQSYYGYYQGLLWLLRVIKGLLKGATSQDA